MHIPATYAQLKMHARLFTHRSNLYPYHPHIPTIMRREGSTESFPDNRRISSVSGASVLSGIINGAESDWLDVIQSQLPGYRLIGILACCCVWGCACSCMRIEVYLSVYACYHV